MTIISDALETLFDQMNDAQGTVATYNGTAVKGDFKRDYQSSLDVEDYGPAFECMAADVPSIAAGSTIVIDSTTYKVNWPPQFHECGHVLLKLTKD